MTIQEARDAVRNLTRVSAFNLSNAVLDRFLRDAETVVESALLEANPSLSLLTKDVTWPAGAFYAQATALLDTMVRKVVMVARRATDTLWERLSYADPQELSGPGVPRDYGIDTATPERWSFNGGRMFLYPVPQRDVELRVLYQRGLPETMTGRTTILETLSPQVQKWAIAVAYLASANVAIALGLPSDALMTLWKTANEAMLAEARAMQAQESGTIAGVRWQL